MNMQSKKKGYSATLVKLFASAALACGMLGASQVATAGIANTKHNLSKTGTQTNHANGANATEICVFCHTPHGGKNENVPLWNKNTNQATSANGYTLYNSSYSSTIDGQVDLTGGVSLACLSCHDGTQAMNNMINAPGSGNYNPAGADFADYLVSGADTDGAGKLKAGIITNLGKDLSNDHPIGIQYCGGGYTAAGGTTCKDSDFNAATGSSPVWWVPQSGSGHVSRTKNDIYLYARNIGNGGLEPMVECASCHDPHTETVTFLRFQNDGSKVCLSCHNK